MAPLKAAQRNKLPPSAFAYPKARKYPMPTKAQARKAGISESQRQTMLSSAKAYSARSSTMGSRTTINRVAAKRK
jgi:hypothetical protein